MKWFDSIVMNESSTDPHHMFFHSTNAWKSHCTLNDVLNQMYPDQEGYAMIRLEEFGQNNLYMLVDLRTARQYEKIYQEKHRRFFPKNPYKYSTYLESRAANIPYERTSGEWGEELDGPTDCGDRRSRTFFEYMVEGDTPFAEDVNLLSTYLHGYSMIPFEDAVTLRGHRQILNGLTSFYEKNALDLKVGCGLADGIFFSRCDDPDEIDGPSENHPLSIDKEIPFDENVPSFYSESMPKYQYCVLNADMSYKFTNHFNIEDMIGVFIYLPTFNLWQYLTVSQLHVLMYVADLKIQYCRMEYNDVDPNFSDMRNLSEYNSSSIQEMLEMTIALATDIGMSKKFSYRGHVISTGTRQKFKDALSFELMTEYQWTIKVTFMQDELGIYPNEDLNPRHYDPTRIDVMNINRRLGVNKKFWLLGVVLQLANLRPDGACF